MSPFDASPHARLSTLLVVLASLTLLQAFVAQAINTKPTNLMRAALVADVSNVPGTLGLLALGLALLATHRRGVRDRLAPGC